MFNGVIQYAALLIKLKDKQPCKFLIIIRTPATSNLINLLARPNLAARLPHSPPAHN
jgi:hypothetical protein